MDVASEASAPTVAASSHDRRHKRSSTLLLRFGNVTMYLPREPLPNRECFPFWT